MSAKNQLVLVRGIPGSGKSTFCKQVFPDILHLENDFFHYHNGEYGFNGRKQEEAIRWCLDMTYLALSRGMDVVVSNTFTKRGYINSYKRMADLFGCDFRVFRLTGKFLNKHGLDVDAVSRFGNNFEDWDDEMMVYPVEGWRDMNCPPYAFTSKKVGDHVRYSDEILKEGGENKTFVVDSITLGTYDMLNVHIKTLDGEDAGIAYPGDLVKVLPPPPAEI